MTLRGKVAIVTGGNSGIGKAVALGLAGAGANIVIDYVANEAATEDLEKQIVALGDQAIGVDADVSKVATSRGASRRAALDAAPELLVPRRRIETARFARQEARAVREQRCRSGEGLGPDGLADTAESGARLEQRLEELVELLFTWRTDGLVLLTDHDVLLQTPRFFGRHSPQTKTRLEVSFVIPSAASSPTASARPHWAQTVSIATVTC